MRGLKAALLATASGRLSKLKGVPCYRGRNNRPLRGVTKALAKLHSAGTTPASATTRAAFVGTAWRGAGGGLRRGRAVDSQVTRIVNRPRSVSRPLKLTRLVFAALKHHGLRPVVAQYVVGRDDLRVGTAVDVVCEREGRAVLLELKCGFASVDRVRAARDARGRECAMRPPLSGAKDTVVNRHLAQLAATRSLFASDARRAARLESKGVGGVDAALLYVCDESSELFWLPAWWERRGEALVRHVARA
jgi:hypothetical protein